MRIVVTGAAGSIGSAVCRDLVARGESVIAFDQDETGLFWLEREVPGIEVRLGDVRREFPAWIAPVSTIIHIAAYKHVGLAERNIHEAIRTNVGGTVEAIKSAARSGARLVFVSTDKAVNPTSVMGMTKRAAEMLCAAEAPESTVVRLVNVRPSRGSVFEIWERQIAKGEPVTVTDPEVRRWFMPLKEAAALVATAAITADPGGRIWVPSTLAEECRIMDLATGILARALYPLSCTVTGLRPGEKLREELLTEAEKATAKEYWFGWGIPFPKGSAIDLDRLVRIAAAGAHPDALRSHLKSLVMGGNQ